MNGFATLTENQALKEAIVAHLQQEGAVTFRDFMEMALYHPQHGYYSAPRPKMGREGDYLTSPEVSPIFGALLGRQIHEMWNIMGCPSPFDLVEMGAGSGALAHDLLAWARHHPQFWQALSYRIVEVSQELIWRQRQRLKAVDPALEKISWSPSLRHRRIEGCLLSNELVDSFPVHRVAVQAGKLSEVYVTWDGGRFQEELRPPSTPAIQAYFQGLGLLPGEGCYAEVNLQAIQWMEAVARHLRRGFVLTFDYGYEAAELYAPWRRQGTLLCFYRHNPSSDPYSRLGRQDMTSHVDCTTLKRVAAEKGLNLLGIVTQAEFLSNLGIAQALGLPGQGEMPLEEYYARRRAMMELTDPAGLGRIKVMVHSKGIAHGNLRGLGEQPP